MRLRCIYLKIASQVNNATDSPKLKPYRKLEALFILYLLKKENKNLSDAGSVTHNQVNKAEPADTIASLESVTVLEDLGDLVNDNILFSSDNNTTFVVHISREDSGNSSNGKGCKERSVSIKEGHNLRFAASSSKIKSSLDGALDVYHALYQAQIISVSCLDQIVDQVLGGSQSSRLKATIGTRLWARLTSSLDLIALLLLPENRPSNSQNVNNRLEHHFSCERIEKLTVGLGPSV